jgi:hypothetical protein
VTLKNHKAPFIFRIQAVLFNFISKMLKFLVVFFALFFVAMGDNNFDAASPAPLGDKEMVLGN